MIDWDSFWTNIYAGSIYFVLGILFSVWLVPVFILRLIRRRNRKFLKHKISYAISVLCEFFNGMPPEFRDNDEYCVIQSKNFKYPDTNDFVSLLKPNLFKPTAIEQTYVYILQASTKNKGINRYELMQDEIKRINILRESLEEITGYHSNSLQDVVINEISQLCLEIWIFEKQNEFNKNYEKLTGEKEGIHGMRNLKIIYEYAYNLLDKLLKQKGFSYTANG